MEAFGRSRIPFGQVFAEGFDVIFSAGDFGERLAETQGAVHVPWPPGQGGGHWRPARSPERVLGQLSLFQILQLDLMQHFHLLHHHLGTYPLSAALGGRSVPEARHYKGLTLLQRALLLNLRRRIGLPAGLSLSQVPFFEGVELTLMIETKPTLHTPMPVSVGGGPVSPFGAPLGGNFSSEVGSLAFVLLLHLLLLL